MSIYPSNTSYTRNDIRLIKLLAEILRDTPNEEFPTNMKNMVHLTTEQVDRLLELINIKLEDKEFALASGFLNSIVSRNADDIRESYLAGRTRRSRTRALASKQVEEFCTRFGLSSANARWYNPADKMSFEYFIRMEQRAFHQMGISPKVADMAIRFIKTEQAEIESVREGKIHPGVSFVSASIQMVKTNLAKLKEIRDGLVDAQQLSGTLTVVVNVGLLYTTRDWSVTGTLSTIAGALGAMAPHRK